MSATFLDTLGNRFLIEGVVDGERDSYASLFSSSVTFRARHVGTVNSGSGGGDVSSSISASPPQQEKNRPAASPKPNSMSDTVMVTYIPLTSRLLGDTNSKEATALTLLLDHVRLRRQVEHPLLRSLFDVFYTTQRLAAPVVVVAPPSVVRRAVDVSSPNASRARTLPERSTSAEASGSPIVARDGDGANCVTCLSPSSTPATALVLIEEMIEGCTLADYADAVTRRRLTPNNAKLQRDAAAIAYQLAQLLHHLHGTGHVLCRELPLECVALDQNRGFVSVRLPLSAVHMLEAAGNRRWRPGTTAQHHSSDGASWAGELRQLRAPELRDVAYWEAASAAAATSIDPASFGAADVWMLGVVTALLCAMNHKQLSQTTRAERSSVAGSDVQLLVEMLPADTQEGILHLIRSCLEATPAKRPTAAGVARSSAFLAHRSHTELEQHRAVISIAEAVAQTRRRKMPPASLQLAESNATAPAARAAPNGAGLADGLDAAPALSSVQDVVWDDSRTYRDIFLASECAADTDGQADESPSPDHRHHHHRDGAPSLSLATHEAQQDVERLCARYDQLHGSESTCPPSMGNAAGATAAHGQLRERVNRSRQMPRDLSATMGVMEELTQRFAHLEKTNPDAAFRLMELLVEGLANCPPDVAAMQESAELADALLRTSRPPHTPDGEEDRLGTADEARLSPSDEVEQRDFQVADVLRVMPSMPERMIESDRAANTSAVLYNRWLKREKKKFVKWDGY